ncbi:hypothetical protein Acsp01_80510 [Actinoplanes sp. NBRC 101535]|nr:hypothetical protein Acsp01_80510 [Actinoplanes sp. NBRC 101535]
MIVTGWLVAVGLAVLVGVVGITTVGAGLTSRQTTTSLSEEQVERELRALAAPSLSSSPSASSPTPSSSSPSSSPSRSEPSASSDVRSQATRGGIVVFDCQRIRSLSPAQGWSVHEQEDDEGEFRSDTDSHVRLKVELDCARGVPQLQVTTREDDD